MQTSKPRAKSISDLVAQIAEDPTLQEQVKANPVQALAPYAVDPLKNDVLIYRIVVIALGSTVLIAMIGAIALTIAGKSIPDILTALGSAAIGAIAGLLAPSPVRGGTEG